MTSSLPWTLMAALIPMLLIGCSDTPNANPAPTPSPEPDTPCTDNCDDPEPTVPPPECDGRRLGEVWLAPDGCSTCACTAQGARCTDEDCVLTLSCDEARSEYEELLVQPRECALDEDCMTIPGQCMVGLGECYHAVLSDFEVDLLRGLGEAYLEEACSEETCECESAPPAVCDAGQCVLGKFCGDYDLGEQWPAGDECNTCTCTLEGRICTEEVCGDPPCEGDDCEEPPTCEELEADYTEKLTNSAACEQDGDCQVLFGQCGVGLGDCYEAVGVDTRQVELSGIGVSYFQAGCTDEICASCDPAPPAVCEDGACALGKFCGLYDLGEQWPAEDRCNTCSCTLEGEVCTERTCPAICDAIEDEYTDLLSSASACEVSSDCRIVPAHCGVGNCFEYINTSVTEEDIEAINVRYREAACIDTVICHCLLPYDVDCVDGRCKGVFEE